MQTITSTRGRLSIWSNPWNDQTVLIRVSDADDSQELQRDHGMEPYAGSPSGSILVKAFASPTQARHFQAKIARLFGASH